VSEKKVEKRRGLVKKRYHCRECEKNFRVPCPIGRLAEMQPICPYCGSDRVSKGWVEVEKLEIPDEYIKLDRWVEIRRGA